jgi:hypothetical protein
MQLFCQSCGRQIPAEDINIDRAIAKCGGCHAVFGFADRIAGKVLLPGYAGQREREPVPMPKGLSVDDWGPELTIIRRWFTWAAIFMVIFCVVWDGFLVAWYVVGMAAGAPLIMLLFPILHVAAGVFITYLTISLFVNRTVIRVAGGELTIRHGPLPWFGNHTLFGGDLEQLYCEEKMHRGKNSTSTTYSVGAILRGGEKKELLSGLETPDQALYIEQQLERKLGIEDRPVSGELSRA